MLMFPHLNITETSLNLTLNHDLTLICMISAKPNWKRQTVSSQQVWLEICPLVWPFGKHTHTHTQIHAHNHQLTFNCHSKCGVPCGNKSLPLWWSWTPVFKWLCECVTAETHTLWNGTYWDLEFGRHTQPRLLSFFRKGKKAIVYFYLH